MPRAPPASSRCSPPTNDPPRGLDGTEPACVHNGELIAATNRAGAPRPRGHRVAAVHVGHHGPPKGVMLSHRSLLSCTRNLMVELPAVETSDVVLHVAPLTHLSGYLALTYFTRGASQVTLATSDPSSSLRRSASTASPCCRWCRRSEHPAPGRRSPGRGTPAPCTPCLRRVGDRARPAGQCGDLSSVQVFVQGYGLTRGRLPAGFAVEGVPPVRSRRLPPPRARLGGPGHPVRLSSGCVDSEGVPSGDGRHGEIVGGRRRDDVGVLEPAGGDRREPLPLMAG